MERNEVQIPVEKSIPGVSMEQMIVPKRLWDNGWIYKNTASPQKRNEKYPLKSCTVLYKSFRGYF